MKKKIDEIDKNHYHHHNHEPQRRLHPHHYGRNE